MNAAPTLPITPGELSHARGLGQAVLLAGLVAGSLDALGAVLNQLAHGRHNPILIFQYIASALIGKPAFAGGWSTAALGLAMHYMIAMSFTAFFFYGPARVRRVREYPWPVGLGYGVFIWLVMTFLALPLTRLHVAPAKMSDAAVAIGILVLAIGWPVAHLARRAYARRDPGKSS